MTNATFAQHAQHSPVTQLRLGRIVGLVLMAGLVLVGGLFWLLKTQAQPIVATAADATTWPAWMRQMTIYPPAEDKAVPPPTPPVDTNAAQFAALKTQMAAQQQALDELNRQLKQRASLVPQAAPAPLVTPPVVPKRLPPATMLFMKNELHEQAATTAAPTYAILPGYYIPCAVETAMNSDTGDITFVAITTTTVYDTATGRYPLIAQGSKIVGEGLGASLLYGNERIRTVSLTLSRRQDKEPIELGQAPLTDQAGVAGLTGKVNQHFWRNVGAVVIGGALRGGTQAFQTAIAGAGPAGHVGGGIAQTGNQVIQRQTSRALDTRPTIEVGAGQLCNVLLTKPLRLTAAQ